MISLFSIPSTDVSVKYLAQLFGNVDGVLVTTTSLTMLATLLKVINTIALTVGSLIVGYVTVVGVMVTAQEGEFMGKKWSHLWTPIRTVMGIALLFPMSSGYSLIQVILMWIVMQGIGAADQLWNTALGYVTMTGSAFAVTADQTGVNTGLQNLFQSLVCEASTRKLTGNTNITYQLNGESHAYYYCDENMMSGYCGGTTGNEPINGTNVPIGSNGVCGSLSIGSANVDKCSGGVSTCTGSDCPSTLACATYEAQKQILPSVMTTLGGIAQELVDADVDYLAFYNTTFPTPTSYSGWIKAFCSGNSINECCITKTPPAAVTAFTGQVSVPCASSSSFPALQSSNSNVSDASKDAMNMYWRYRLAPALSGTSTDFIDTVMAQYLVSIQTAVNNYINSQIANQTSTDWSDAKQQGWLSAGGYYYDLAGTAGNTLADANPTLSVSTPDFSNTMLTGYRVNYNASALIQQNAQTTTLNQNGTLSNMAPQVQIALANADSSASSFISDFSNDLTGGGANDPLSHIAMYGHKLMVIAESLYTAFLVGGAVLSGASAINFMALGSGLTGSPFKATVGFLLMALMPLIFAAIAALFALGTLLGVYVPLIPYILFTMAALGWIIIVIEVMVAGPLIALGILSPGGQSEILGHASHALMMIFNLFLRPALIVFGLMAAMMLAPVAIGIVNIGFGMAMSSIVKNLGTAPGLVELIIFMAVYAYLIVTVMNKVFSLVYAVPDQVTSWIGYQHRGAGEGQALDETKGGVAKAGGGVSGAAATGGETVKVEGKAYQTKEMNKPKPGNANVTGNKPNP